MLSKDKPLVLLSLFLLFALTLTLALLSNGTYESGDSIQHYLIAHYAFDHPELFLDHWGKPFFTLLSAPFAAFGFTGIVVFNILCASLTAYFAWRIASKMGMALPALALFFVFFSPIYYVTLISGLTEPLFGLMLVASIYLILQERNTAAAMLVSFLPFVRSEGFLLLPLFAWVLLGKRSWRATTLLGAGTVLYSVIGSFYYGDLLWIMTENPYKASIGMYGTGSVFHYLKKNEYILGTPLVVLFVLGLLRLGKMFGERKAWPFYREEIVLVFGCFLVYLAAHSWVYAYGSGISNSLGLIRVLAGVTPLAALIALRGLQWLLPLFKEKILLRNAFVALLLALVAWMPFKQHRFPRKFNYEELPVKAACDWIQENQAGRHKIYYMFPYAVVFLEIDPFDADRATMLWNLDTRSPAINMPAGSLVIWDSHYAPLEGKLPLQELQEDGAFEELIGFKGDPAEVPKDVGSFEVRIFRKK